jgi:hypothetical protein
MKRLLPILALLICAGSFAQVKEKKIRKYAATIKAKELKQKLSVIASAEMEGRETATEGQRKAAAYIENKFREIGLKPRNGDNYQLHYDLFVDSLTAYSLSLNGTALQPNKDYSVSVNSSANGAWNISEIYFAGAGVLDTTQLDVKDKWVVTDETGFNPLRQKIAQLRRRQVKGIILVSKSFPRTTPFALKSGMDIKTHDLSNTYPYFTVSYATLAQILNKASLDSASLSVMSKTSYPTNLSLTVARTELKLKSSNVLGILEGSDKKDEYVFLTAHYDHLGKRGDSIIYYGADDDGSGTTAIIELAEAFAKARKKGHGPRRSIVFMTVSGEEKGLLGSEYYTDHPLYPLAKTTVNLNIDMVGRIDPKFKGDSLNYVYVIGDDKLSSELAPITDSINKKYIGMELDRRYNDIKDPNRYYFRSDHYNFAKKGVPIIFYFNGTHADYHRPSDTVEKIQFDLMQKRVRLVFYTAWEMANREGMLKRDLPLNIPAR